MEAKVARSSDVNPNMVIISQGGVYIIFILSSRVSSKNESELQGGLISLQDGLMQPDPTYSFQTSVALFTAKEMFFLHQMAAPYSAQ